MTAAPVDIVVYGGTPGGLIAEVAAARLGASTPVLEQTEHVGGLSTSGLVSGVVLGAQRRDLVGVDGAARPGRDASSARPRRQRLTVLGALLRPGAREEGYCLAAGQAGATG